MYMVQEFSIHALQEQLIFFFFLIGSPTILRSNCARSPENFLRLNKLRKLALIKYGFFKYYRSNTFPKTSLEELKAAVQSFLVAAMSGRLKVHCNLHFYGTVQFGICRHDSPSPISSLHNPTVMPVPYACFL